MIRGRFCLGRSDQGPFRSGHQPGLPLKMDPNLCLFCSYSWQTSNLSRTTLRLVSTELTKNSSIKDDFHYKKRHYWQDRLRLLTWDQIKQSKNQPRARMNFTKLQSILQTMTSLSPWMFLLLIYRLERKTWTTKPNNVGRMVLKRLASDWLCQ